ncbi:PAG15-like protein [Mya arenaria]|uniref:PAG15-like protein n=1 Tax=Mya arenaria TaxID=6604 RepID=A0ABY7ESZ6_MYAAR|nr:PAG15-like protein [Mya arenaria]
MAVDKIAILFLFGIFAFTEAGTKLNPVVLVPGDGGSQFQAKLNKPTTVASYCIKKTDYYYDLWLNLEQLVPFLIDCFVDNMRLEYDNVTRTTRNSPGVDVKIPGFGGTETVEWLDHSHISLNEMKLFFVDLQQLIERAYYTTGNQKVFLLAHSMGNPVTLYFLNHMTNAWKAKFIQSFISLAGVWGGAAKPIRLMISAWLMPSDQFWGPDEVLVMAPTRNYTIRDYKQLFKDINYETGYMMWEDTHALINPLKAPGVEMHCLHGVNVTTPKAFRYTNKTWHESYPETIPDDGDGTVNIRSLHGCLKFKKMQKQPIYHKEFDKAEHMQILNLKSVIDYLKKVFVKS